MRRRVLARLLAGTAVGPSTGEAPRPASSPLLVVYPVGWLVTSVGRALVEAQRAGTQTRAQTLIRMEIDGIAEHERVVAPRLPGCAWLTSS
jgi:hypothetical protein